MKTQREALAAAVAAKLAYWDALAELEKTVITSTEELTDRQNDRMVDAVDDLAVCAPNAQEVFTWVTQDHVESFKKCLRI